MTQAAAELALMTKNEEIPAETYSGYKCRLKCDGKYVAGVSKVSSLAGAAHGVTCRAAAALASHERISGHSEFSAITLERGVTYDPAFVQWAKQVSDDPNSGVEHQKGDTGNQHVPLLDFRKNIVLELYNEVGQKVIGYNFHRCWPSEFVTLPEMETNGYAVAILSLKLENEGWESDACAHHST